MVDNDIEVIELIKAAVDPKQRFSDRDFEQMKDLLLACILALREDANMNEVQALLGNIPNGFSGWLNTVQEAITKAEIADAAKRAFIYGSFRMSRMYLYAIDQARQAPTAPL